VSLLLGVRVHRMVMDPAWQNSEAPPFAISLGPPGPAAGTDLEVTTPAITETATTTGMVMGTATAADGTAATPAMSATSAAA
jgi:hypothetical protein